jgi:hypothetical protein
MKADRIFCLSSVKETCFFDPEKVREVLLITIAVVAMLCSTSITFASEKPSPGRWPDGEYHWFYNPKNHPAWLTDDEARDLVQTAASAWKTAAGVKFVYMGETTVPSGKMDGVNVVGWSLAVSPKLRGLTLGRADKGRLLERDIAIRPDRKEFELSLRLLQKVITHEFGHAIGLTHSDRCDDVMTLAADCPKADPETLPLAPTAHDLERCRILYGVPTETIRK